MLCAALVSAQQPDEKPVRVVTDEVRLNVTAQNEFGHFDPTVTRDDVMIVEDGVPQRVESLRRAPASVLFLLDTGGELNFVKGVGLTRLIALQVLRDLPENEDAFAAVQFYDKAETVSDWTSSKSELETALQTKLFGGQKSRFSKGVEAALTMFAARSLENRHLVLITDGADTDAELQIHQQALQNLLAANITVHVVNYANLERQFGEQAARRVTIINKERTPQRLPDWVVEAIVKSFPSEAQRRMFRAMNKAQRISQVNLDDERIKAVKAQQEIWRTREAELSLLAADTGGTSNAPETFEFLLKSGAEIAAAVKSQYVVTYQPKNPITDSAAQTRTLRVVARRVNLQLNTRRKLIFGSTK